MEIRQQIEEWFTRGGTDFDSGIALLKQVNKNTYYLRNIEWSGRLKTLGYELGKHRHSVTKPKITNDKKTVLPQPIEGTVNKIGQQVKGAGKPFVLREEFPFLNEKDCPAHIKIAVSDMITAHANYTKAHEKLFETVNKGDAACYDTANDVMTNYLENKRIWGELETYKNRHLQRTPVQDVASKVKAEDVPPGKSNDSELLKVLGKIKYKKRLLGKETDKKKREKILDELIKLTAIRDGKT